MAKIKNKYQRIIKEILAFESEFSQLKDEEFKAKTSFLKLKIKSGANPEKLLPFAYALVKEAAKRTLGLVAFDVQLLGAIGAYYGYIVEMKTGEGKTLSIIFPAYFWALFGKGVHVITANDYLAERDGKWMKAVYNLLGLSVDYVVSSTTNFDRQVAYAADVTYVTGSEVCFDYLKDNMIYDEAERSLRGFHFAIVDEADSVLIDEAQIPLVISGEKEDASHDREIFFKIKPLVDNFEEGADFKKNQKTQVISFTEQGIFKLEKFLGVENLYGKNQNEDYLYYAERLLKAYHLFEKDKDYIVEDGKVVIVDEYTGRLMPGHRYYQGIHQALEVKEGVVVEEETDVFAFTTYQHFFSLYEKFCGFTGTAQTAEKELKMIYGKEVMVVPTNLPVVRIDRADKFFVSWQEKLAYLAWASKEYFFKGRPILIGTRSVAKSYQVHGALLKENVPANVLNAKHTNREAEVIAQAGRGQTVTVATNMAGRGTDIELSDDSKKQGGLVVFGLERHNARRIDDQLIGRGGRQGDPGMSQFLISSDDELIRIHFREEYLKLISRYKENSKGVTGKALIKLLAKAQKRMEDLFFEQRVLNYELDKVVEAQRKSFYRQRLRILNDDDLRTETLDLVKEQVFREAFSQYQNKKYVFPVEAKRALDFIQEMVGNGWFKIEKSEASKYQLNFLKKIVFAAFDFYYRDFEKFYGIEKTRKMEKLLTLKVLDLVWKNHLGEIENFQESALIDSLGDSNFYADYEIKATLAYQKMLLNVPPILTRTFLGTIRRLWNQTI